MKVEIEDSWRKALEDEFEKEYFRELWGAVGEAYRTKTVFPPEKLIFNAFQHCPLNKTKVVILGQDPYHGAGQAHGLAFSVPETVKIPPSLKNIYTEIESDTVSLAPQSGNLERWGDQGVLLLNTTLTVEEGLAGSHQKFGWERFTDTVIEKVSAEQEHVVFLLWGNFAQKKGAHIDNKKHLVLTSAHPSPLSVYRGFYGCRHFSKANAFLKKHGLDPIKW